MSNDLSFFQKRMQLLGVTDDNNKITVHNPEAEYPMPSVTNRPIFSEDKDGNIEICFSHIDGTIVTYYTDTKNQKPREWKQVRLKEPIGDMKYKIVKGQGTFPFFPPNLQNAFTASQEIETLFLTEGAFKAFKASQYGLPVVGLTSITHYKDKTGSLHAGIIRLIERCNIKNVVILWDGDCLDISQSQLYHKEDLTKRPSQFFYSVKAIRTLIYNVKFPDRNKKLLVYFGHVKSNSFPKSPKGLDDILIEAESSEKHTAENVASQCKKINAHKNPFFQFYNISASTSNLFSYFRLNNVELFYHRHAMQIGNQEFVFEEDVYSWNEGKNKLECIAPAWAKSVFWIGDDFFKIVEEPSAHGGYNRVLTKRSKQTLSDLYGKDFYVKIPYFEGFCNVPNHFDYKNTHGKFYNRYFPFPHQANEGDYTHSLELVKHIFGNEDIEYKGETYKSWELGLDYIHNLIFNPTQILPVLVLFSKENATGKSTFCQWMRDIFGNNTIQVTNNDFKSNFNDHWTDKLLVICEETLLDRKKDAEKVKAYSTSINITVNPKGYKPFNLDVFFKFIFCTNNEKMLYVSKYDERYWIREIPVPKKKNANLQAALKKEIPAFIHMMKNRKPASKKVSRMYFAPQMIRTEALSKTVQVNEPQDALELKEKIKEMFLDFQQTEIQMPLKHINKEFFRGTAKSAWIKTLLHDYLEVDKIKDKNGKPKQVRGSYFKFIDSFEDDAKQLKRVEVKFNDRPYVFHRRDFVTQEEELADSIF